jgi:hypothetical protein
MRAGKRAQVVLFDEETVFREFVSQSNAIKVWAICSCNVMRLCFFEASVG